MKYILENIEDDDFVAEVLSELRDEIFDEDNKNMEVTETVDSDRKTKGAEIFQLGIEIADWCMENASFLESVISGIVAAGLYEKLKTIIDRLKRTQEYVPEKRMLIVREDDQGRREQIEITMQEILEKDIR